MGQGKIFISLFLPIKNTRELLRVKLTSFTLISTGHGGKKFFSWKGNFLLDFLFALSHLQRAIIFYFFVSFKVSYTYTGVCSGNGSDSGYPRHPAISPLVQPMLVGIDFSIKRCYFTDLHKFDIIWFRILHRFQICNCFFG